MGCQTIEFKKLSSEFCCSRNAMSTIQGPFNWVDQKAAPAGTIYAFNACHDICRLAEVRCCLRCLRNLEKLWTYLLWFQRTAAAQDSCQELRVRQCHFSWFPPMLIKCSLLSMLAKPVPWKCSPLKTLTPRKTAEDIMAPWVQLILSACPEFTNSQLRIFASQYRLGKLLPPLASISAIWLATNLPLWLV